MDFDQAIPLGLVVNELVTNALKHAFPPDKPGPHRVEVEVTRNGDQVTARVGNNGVPFPPEVDVESAGTFGLQLVNLLVTSQLEGTIRIDKTGEPACHITFPAV